MLPLPPPPEEPPELPPELPPEEDDADDVELEEDVMLLEELELDALELTDEEDPSNGMGMDAEDPKGNGGSDVAPPKGNGTPKFESPKGRGVCEDCDAEAPPNTCDGLMYAITTSPAGMAAAHATSATKNNR